MVDLKLRDDVVGEYANEWNKWNDHGQNARVAGLFTGKLGLVRHVGHWVTVEWNAEDDGVRSGAN